jgi:hypothetical protein
LHVFNLVLRTGTFLEELKLAKVIPIHKEGDKADSLGPVYEFVCISFRTDNLNCFRAS